MGCGREKDTLKFPGGEQETQGTDPKNKDAGVEKQ